MLPALFLIAAAVLYRLLYAFAGSPPDWTNFSPLASIFLVSGLYLPRTIAGIVPWVAVVASDLILNWHYHVPLFDTRMLSGYFCFALTLLLGFALRRATRWRLPLLLGTCILGSTLFYVVTNTIDWWFDSAVPNPVPLYPHTLAGWFQALTIGHPGYSPTILFYRNTLLSDLLFTLLFVLSFAVTTRRWWPSPAIETQRIAI
ncbi:MAG: hypothetical protein JO308_11115 [Verrucomicrobia bacterium]|nr:hypothetical protein [Verrucomicrobiota bacterium]